MNVARIGLLLAGLPNSVAGMTINRFCSSGLNAVSIAADRIRTGEADIMIAAGTESMSMIPMLGRLAMNEAVFARGENVGIAYGMGITAENVAAQWKISREEQDAFALASHQKALAAQAERRVRRRDQRDHRAREPARPGDGRDRHPQPRNRARRRPARRHVRRRTGQAAAGVRGQGFGHRGQQLADVRRRRRVDPRFRTRAEGVEPCAARALGRLRGRRRAAGDHGRRPDRGDPQGAASPRAWRRTRSTGSN